MKLDEARVEALRQRITNRGALYLNHELYRLLHFDGWTRSQVDGAIEKLVAAGEIAAEPTPHGVRVRWLGQESGS